MKDEWWLTAAVSDDTLVADLLLRLKDSSTTTNTTTILLPSWGARQPRSSAEKRKNSPRHRSPTTPLSFSDAACEESSANNNHLPLPSKISASSETPMPTTTTSKRPRKKKTFAELKEEESSLLKEKAYLKQELATLHLALEKQRSINENLKRMKLDSHLNSGLKSEANCIQLDGRNINQSGASESTSSNVSRQVKNEDASEPDSCPVDRDVTLTSPQLSFALPDLNMMPDELCGEEGILGMS